ncbi:MAG TPA: DNA-binding response regulator [Rhodocyclaceae bacterium]|nr:MAG: DNA-binding response regulator [Betaproteobacteria bacterium CG2_30_68_42]PIV73165.1 MAG: DNA-binding response regulator [Rhodocyclales bacterium CG17_big_fil_post_rev_8_21_14_2_50_68_7]HCX32794.1 DNA-binding response regulator [Rhodocyclaceae bacterium]
MIRVLVVDNHALMCAGLRLLVREMDGIEVVGEAGDGRAAIDAVRRLHPEVALIDLILPRMNGLEAIRRIHALDPAVRIVALSMHSGTEYVGAALRAGACGYLVKDAAPQELENAIREAAAGGSYLAPRISREAVEAVLDRLAESGAAPDILTPRQREVLQAIAEGESTKQIAFRLGLSPKTVETHRAMLMSRLGIREVAGLVRWAIRNGVISTAS